jgi:hypothetical protein
VVAQCADERLHLREFAAYGNGAPFFEEPTRPARAVVLPEGVEGFLERQSSDRFQFVFEQIAEFGGLPDGEVRPALEKTGSSAKFVGELWFG